MSLSDSVQLKEGYRVSFWDRVIDELRAHVEELTWQVAALAGKLVRSAQQAEVCTGCLDLECDVSALNGGAAAIDLDMQGLERGV
jgi:hypothetical protein